MSIILYRFKFFFGLCLQNSATIFRLVVIYITITNFFKGFYINNIMKLLTRYILSNFGGSVVDKRELEKICKKFNAKSERTTNFMITYGYLIRILRGLYYVKTIEEFKFNHALNIYKIISLGMDKLKIRWYFGLYTALKFNKATHEYFDTIFVLNNKIFRPKEIRIANEKVKFIKLKEILFGFGIKEKETIKFSDLEKTLLDFIYISKYRSIPDEKIISMIEEYGRKVNKRRISTYLKFYPKSVEKVIENAKFL